MKKRYKYSLFFGVTYSLVMIFYGVFYSALGQSTYLGYFIETIMVPVYLFNNIFVQILNFKSFFIGPSFVFIWGSIFYFLLGLLFGYIREKIK